MAGVLDTIESNIERADKIISALVDFSRVGVLDLKPLNIASVLEGSLVLILHRVKLGNIEIVKKFKKKLPKVFVDKTKMEQVFVNLYLNAIQAMPRGGKLHLRTYSKEIKEVGKKIGRRTDDIFKPQDKVVIIEVEDTGVGISEEDLKNIFDPFFTTKGPRGGAGLGLAVTKNIIEMHKGIIEITSQKDKGTKITIMLKAVNK